MRVINKSIAFVLISIFIVFAQKKQEFTSPGMKTHAVIYNIHGESKIHILNSKGRILFDTSFISEDREHGFGVIRAGWTANSKFFVFSVHSSGGQQPWHFPIFIYSVSGRKLLCIDNLFGAVTSDFKLSPPDSLETIIMKKNINDTGKINIKLADLISRK